MVGPLSGKRVVEFAGIGPAPFCGMLLSDMGADVLRLDRPTNPRPHLPQLDFVNRGKRSVAIDLKAPGAASLALELCRGADVLIEGFRPGVMERLGLGPAVALEHNEGLVYARMTCWGQDGPLAGMPGHDINPIALTGILHAIGERGGPPAVPLNLVGDYAGAAYLAIGILAALVNVAGGGEGQVVDGAMVDSAASMMTFLCGLAAQERWREARGTNFLDGSSPWYAVYRTADGEYMAVGAMEQPFYEELLRHLGLADEPLPSREDAAGHPELRRRIAEAFLQRSQSEWSRIFAGVEACVTPVLALSSAPAHEHLSSRGTFETAFGHLQPAPAPRFSKTPAEITSAPPVPGQHTEDALHSWGIDRHTVTSLLRSGALYSSDDTTRTHGAT